MTIMRSTCHQIARKGISAYGQSIFSGKDEEILCKALRAGAYLALLAMLFLVMPYSLEAADPSLKLAEDGVFQEGRSGRMWLMERSKRLKTSEEVAEYLNTLNQGKFSDWRLPTRQELYDLFCIFDLKESGEVKIRLEGAYWLKGETEQPEVGAWEIGDDCGPTRKYFQKKAGYVRAVRP